MRFLPLLALFFLTAPISAQGPTVLSVVPASGFVGAQVNGDIIVELDQALDPATVTSESFRVFGRWSGPATGTIALENGDSTIRFVLDEPCAFGETVTVTMSKAIENTSGEAMSHAYSWAFWTQSHELTEIIYQEVSWMSLREQGEGNIISYGAYAGDLNNDGWSDLAVPNEIPADVRVLLNEGNGTYDSFTTFPLPDGALPSTNEGGDFNEDGNIDIAVGNGSNNRLSIMLGDGEGGFPSLVSYEATGLQVRGLAVLDADGDGHEDIVTANRASGTLSYFKGNGDGTFATATGFDAGGSGETGVVPADANGDGITDLFVGALGSDEIIAMLGDGDGAFSVSDRIDVSGSPWMLATGDIDGDGDADVVAAGSNGNVADVVFGDGSGGFESTTSYSSGSFPLAIDLGDVDGDGDLDMVVSNYGSGDFSVFENNGSGQYSLVQTLEVNGAGSCVVLHDRDNDGVIEITGIDEVDDRLYFYESIGTVASEVPGEHPMNLVVGTNPFRNATVLRFELATSQDVRLRIYDMLGREVAVLVDGRLPDGEHSALWSAKSLPSGVYVASLETQIASTSARLTLVK